MEVEPGDASSGDLQRGRESYARRAWLDAHRHLTSADQAGRLPAPDLELLAVSAFMLGRVDEWAKCQARAFAEYRAANETLGAVRCAVWLWNTFRLGGQTARANGWLGRARRLLDDGRCDGAQHGYLLVALSYDHELAGDLAAAITVIGEAAAAGERWGDADLAAISRQRQGNLLIAAGRITEGIRLLDEAMLGVTGAELSPVSDGFVYCGVLMGCQAAFELRRAQEWTAAMTQWCAQQPDMVSFAGACLVYRAEIMQLRGSWDEALAEAQQARERCERAMDLASATRALYLQGEIHRLRGDFPAAEQAYRAASATGCEPQPGLALLRLAQGSCDSAVAAIRRATGETPDPSKRAVLLPALIEILLAAGETETARAACAELEDIARRYDGSVLDGVVAYARGAVDLAGGDALAALPALRHAWHVWQELDAPYEAARARVLVARACAVLEDHDSAALERDAARATFARLGAEPDLAPLSAATGTPEKDVDGLTAREVHVLRLLAAGRTNREIAGTLVISEHTVARRVQNIYRKLGVSSRAAAGAVAFARDLVPPDASRGQK